MFRWLLSAAHCFRDVTVTGHVTIRDNSENENIIGIKKLYKHPYFQYPSLYDDIALVELGRRIVFNFDDVSFFYNFSLELKESIYLHSMGTPRYALTREMIITMENLLHPKDMELLRQELSGLYSKPM